MNHAMAHERLSEYRDGELAPELRADLESHLNLCADCRGTLDAWLFASRFLFSGSAVPSPIETEAFTARVMSRLAERASSGSKWYASYWPGSGNWLLPLAGAALALAALLVTPAGSQDPVEALLQQDEGGSTLLEWLSGPPPSSGDAMSLTAGEL